MISARIVADSVNPLGNRLTSFVVKYPRWLHSEQMTHRAFSRNAASSRAIPLKRMIADITDEPALPEYWGAEQKGMQSGDELTGHERMISENIWLLARNHSIQSATGCNETGLHKSLCNRLIEPFAHITVLITASDKGLANFFALRAHAAAMPEFQVLAFRMLALYIESSPVKLNWGQWHIPVFQGGQEYILEGNDYQRHIKIATARCARLSYLTFDGNHEPEKDIALHDQLLASKHLSPFEHCAKAINPEFIPYSRSNFDGDSLCGFLQYRKMIEGENQTEIDLTATLAKKPDWITL